MQGSNSMIDFNDAPTLQIVTSSGVEKIGVSMHTFVLAICTNSVLGS